MAAHVPAARKRWQATLIITLFILAVAGAAFTGWRFARESPPHQGPIVLLTVDALRADRLPAYGGPAGATPNINAIESSTNKITKMKGFSKGARTRPGIETEATRENATNPQKLVTAAASRPVLMRPVRRAP